MFKLESYVTPLILSYVDKYIKNIKPEDSQLSLWGGEAVFNNLDLKLDVLEQELNLPFTFVNGHIHELRINVPWTKLVSEPVVITINTIECILKLKTENEVSTDSSSRSTSSQQQSGGSSKKQNRRQEYSEIPPNYVQSLIGRVINNICIVCNNLILKYVEDDIVLSLNIKSAELFNANEKWERMFIDLNPLDPVLRKVVNMQDLTVCLDRRDASGKIQIYQDPLLYRCSTIWRWYSAYGSPHSKQAAVTRIHVFCDCLDFSVTDQQLPMLLRLGQLCLLLLYGEIGCNSEEVENSCDSEEGALLIGEQNNQGLQAIDDGSNVGWASWAWSFVPEILPIWGDEEGSDELSSKLNMSRIIQFGLFIDKASCVFKLTETFQDSSYYSPPKLSFQPVSNLNLYGIAIESTKKGEDYSNVQMGITGIILTGIGECPCNNQDIRLSKDENNYFRAGVLPSSGHTYNYCTSSLFDPLAPENCNQRREYVFDREAHLTRLTENVLIERFPAFAFDYFYELELPEDWQGSYFDITPSYLEKNNFRERSLFRMVLGPSCLEISSDMIHRFLKFYHYANNYEYPPYNMIQPDSISTVSTLSEEDIEDLEEFVPQRIYHVTLMKLYLHLQIGNHPYHKTNTKGTSQKSRKKDRNSKFRDVKNVPLYKDQSFMIVLSMDSIDFQLSKPMYPYKMATITSGLEKPSETLLHHCHAHYSVKVFGLEATLAREQKALHTLSLPCSFAFCRKLLLFPVLWSKQPNMRLMNEWLEISSINIHLKHSHLMALLYIYYSWTDISFVVSHQAIAFILQNILLKDKPMIILQLHNLEWHRIEMMDTIACEGSIGKINLYLENNDQSLSLLHGPEDTKNIHKAAFFHSNSNESNFSKSGSDIDEKSCIAVGIRYPKQWAEFKNPILLNLRLNGMAGNLDPAIKFWFLNQAAMNTVLTAYMKMADTSPITSPRLEESLQGGSLSSSQTPTPSNSQGASKSQSFPITGTPPKMSVNEILSSDLVEQAIYFYTILKCIVAQIEIESCCILFTSQPWATSTVLAAAPYAPILSCWKDAFANELLCGSCVLSLPQLKLQNRNISNAKQGKILSNEELLAVNLEDWNSETGMFSWTVQLKNFSLYSLHTNGKIHYILKPTSSATTLADNTKSTPAVLTQLGFCIHIDTEPLHFCCSAKQVQLMVNSIKYILDFYESCNINTWMSYLRTDEAFGVVTPIEPISNANVLLDTSMTVSNPAEIIDVSGGEREINSEEASSLTDASSKAEEKVKITLWLQFTLPKFSTSLFGKQNKDIDSWIQLEAEEITLSLDIQEVYMKAKCKVSSFNISSFLKSEKHADWVPGPFRGIVLCSTNKLTHNIHMGSPKHINITTMPFYSNQMTDLQNHGFLSLTYTKALCKNVKKKLVTKFQSHSTTDKRSDSQKLFFNQQSRRYISEIDVQINPFDAVLWMPFFTIVSQTVSSLLCLTGKKSLPSANSTKPIGWNINNHILPLFYINAKTIRVFLPKTTTYNENFEENINAVQELENLKETSTSDTKTFNTEIPDLCLLHIGSINLIPQADNPLSRIVLHKELYQAAQQSRTLAIPGSDIEDRQYQLDICGLAVNAVQWEEVMTHSNLQTKENSSHSLIMGENPALEWNTRLNGKQNLNENTEVTCVPVLSQFDVRVTFAPAILYKPPLEDGKELEDILICGHSFELNLTNDVDIYLSIQQMSLLSDIFENNIGVFLNSINELEILNKNIKKYKQKSKGDTIMDSGIDSECSQLQQGSSHFPLLYPSINLLESTDASQKQNNGFVPFEILITAGSISVTLFAHECDDYYTKPAKVHTSLKKRTRRRHHVSEGKDDADAIHHQKKKTYLYSSTNEFQVEETSTDSSPLKSLASILVKNENLFLNEEEGYDGSHDSSGSDSDNYSKENLKKKLSKLFPFLYFTIVQPHAFMTCYPSTQKLEISCFDAQIKGMTAGHYIFEAENSMIPMPEIFTIPWLETRPGEADAKTGIPPSFYTLTCKDFLYNPVKIHLCLKRPVKCNLSSSKWHQVSSFINSVLSCVFKQAPPPMKTSEENEDEKPKTDWDNNIIRYREAIAHIHSFEISSVQTVFVVDLGHKPQDLQVTFTTENMYGILEKTPSEETENFKIDLTSLLLKTACNGHVCPLIGPFSLKAQLMTIWKPWHLCVPLPQLLLHLQGDAVLLRFGPKQLESLQTLYKIIEQDFMNTMDKDTKDLPKSSEKNQLQDHKKMESSDDLRKGSFQYIQDTEGVGLDPSPQQIVFCKKNSGEQGAMTWCYPEPRALTCVTVYPVPLHPSAGLSETENILEQVECSLQYWDKLHHNFVNYCNFQLSETFQYNLDLPVVCSDSGYVAVVSEMWRIVLYNTEEDSKTEILSSGALSPLVLAACMRVDSCFDPALVPVVSISINFDFLQLSIYNHFKKIESPVRLHPFSFDDEAPQDQEFIVISIDDLSVNYKKWHQQLKIDVLTNITCEILEYRFLTMRTMLEPFDVQGQLYVNMETEKPLMYESKITLHPCFIHISQSVIHTLSIGIEAWEQILSNSLTEMKQLIPTYYIICNNTHQTIFIGQVDTDEAITLSSQKMHAYSWRSHKNKQLLRVCVENMKWKWFDSFNPDSNGTVVRTVKNKEHSLTLMITVLPFSSSQKQIIIDGQLFISNKLNQNLEVQFQTVNPFVSMREWTGYKITVALNKQSVLPSYSFNRYQIRMLRVRLMGLDTPWSENITVTENKTPINQLVKIPMKGSQQYLSVWCHVLDKKITQKTSSSLILFLPLFMVRNHLPHPLLAHLCSNVSHCVEVAGQGEEHQLITTGDVNLHHSLSFQMASGMKMSAPAIILTSNLIDEIKDSSAEIDFQQLCSQSVSTQSFCWPYDNSEINCQIKELSRNAKLSNVAKPSHFSHISKPSELPDIELQVNLSQQWPGCNTVLVDVKPYTLLINKTNIDLYMVESNGQEWKISRYSIFTPPSLQNEFKFGIRHHGKLFLSNSLQMCKEDTPYWSKSENMLPSIGYITVSIKISNKSLKVCSFLVSSIIEEGITVVSIQPAFCIVNKSNQDLHMINYALKTVPDQAITPSYSNQKPMTLKATVNNSTIQPILYWEVYSSVSDVMANDTIHCFEFSHPLEEETNDNVKIHSNWSYPIYIPSTSTTQPTLSKRYTFAIKEVSKSHTKPYVMTYHEKNGVKYLVISHDACPMLLLHNETQYTLVYGQSYNGSNKNGATVFEQAEYRKVCQIRPACSAHYTLPVISQEFPNYVESLPTIHFALFIDEQHDIYWSAAIDITRDNDQFVHIPNCGDVRIHKEKVGHTRHIFIDPVNRVEVSAKEIRSRIGVNKHLMLSSSSSQTAKLDKEFEIGSSDTKSDPSLGDWTVNHHLHIPVQKAAFYLSFSGRHICVILSDDHIDTKEHSKEILRLTVNNILAASRPYSIKSHEHVLRYNHYAQEFNICIGAIQLDNQMDGTGTNGFDFPVVIVPQDSHMPFEAYTFKELSFQSRWAKARETAHVFIHLLLEQSVDNIIDSSTMVIENLSIYLRPFSLYIEDSLCYKLLEVQPSFVPFSPQTKLPTWKSDLQLPWDVDVINSAFASPIHIQHLHIDSINILLSIHASIKLYLSIDQSPLSFKPFDKIEVFTTTFKLGQLVTHHFLTGALLRAGWVVGSLDLLGNPAGFARAVSNGMSDFFCLPYYGLLQGPWAFISGVSHGSVSLLQQVTSGALISVTNLAASVSRNMDFLSMDADHLCRQEELRRQKPVGISMGLLQGLTSFGISLLGSIAGIVEQPIQEILSQKLALTPTSSVLTATGFVKGVGKGLVGVVAKPIGGAAEFVSQAGQGLLEGSGWRKQPLRQHWPIASSLEFGISKMKFIWKLSQNWTSEVMLCVEATHLNQCGKYVSDILLLTTEVLIVLGKDGDTVQQQFALTEIDCQETEYKSVIQIIPKLQPADIPSKVGNQTKDRVEEYISKTSQYTNVKSDWNSVSLPHSPVVYQYYIHPKLRPVIMSMFNVLQRRLLEKGFSV